MKAIYSMRSYPASTGTERSMYKSAGWFINKYYLSCARILSVYLARKQFGTVELYTDDEWIEFVVNELWIKFDKVVNCLSDLHNHVDKEFRAYGKLIAYSLQDEPYIHVDFDCFLEKSLPDWFLSLPMFGQFFESLWYWHHYKNWLFLIRDTRSQWILPKEFDHYNQANPDRLRAINMWIFWWTDVKAMKDYADKALKIVPDNYAKLIQCKVEWRCISDFNVIMEQYMMYAYVNYHDIKHNVLMLPNHENWWYWITHFLGDMKSRQRVCDWIETKLRDYCPELIPQLDLLKLKYPTDVEMKASPNCAYGTKLY